jgi:hypothetical protein
MECERLGLGISGGRFLDQLQDRAVGEAGVFGRA